VSVVLIIGGKGFVGSAVTRRVIADGGRVVCVEPKATPGRLAHLGDSVEIVAGDVRDLEGLATIAAEHDVDAMVVAPFYRGRSVYDELTVMAGGTWTAFEAARASGVKRVVFASSIRVYGPQSLHGDVPLNELSPCLAQDRYGVYKRLGEVVAGTFNRRYGMEIACVRLSTIYGPGVREGAVGVSLAPVQAATEGAVRMPYDPDARLCLAHVDDAAQAIAALATGPPPRHTIYELGGRLVTYREMAEIATALVPASVEFVDGEGFEHSFSFLMDNRRLVDEIGLEHRTVEQGYREIVGASGTPERSI
jgi:nucleoside-diphosphate-sugar epimerase